MQAAFEKLCSRGVTRFSGKPASFTPAWARRGLFCDPCRPRVSFPRRRESRNPRRVLDPRLRGGDRGGATHQHRARSVRRVPERPVALKKRAVSRSPQLSQCIVCLTSTTEPCVGAASRSGPRRGCPTARHPGRERKSYRCGRRLIRRLPRSPRHGKGCLRTPDSDEL